MTPRDEKGRYVSKNQTPKDAFGSPDRGKSSVSVDIGRGEMVSVAVGAPFVDTVEDLGRKANYGGYFRVFLARAGENQQHEVIDPDDAPEKVEAGMRISLTPYDKVGKWCV